MDILQDRPDALSGAGKEVMGANAVLTRPEKVKLHTLLGNYPNVIALKDGRLKSDLVEFDFPDFPIPNRGFKPLVREHKFDLGELAIVTFLQAKSYGAALRADPGDRHGPRPAPHRRLQFRTRHDEAIRPQRQKVSACAPTPRPPASGCAAFSRKTTASTGARCRSSPWRIRTSRNTRIRRSSQRAPESKQLPQMLIDGEVDAALIGDKFPDPRFKTLIPDAEAANRKWAETHGGVPINHMLVARASIAKSRPDVIKEVFRLFRDARQADAASKGALDPYRFGVEANRALARAHHRLRVPPADDPAQVHRGRAVRRRNARARRLKFIGCSNWCLLPLPIGERVGVRGPGILDRLQPLTRIASRSDLSHPNSGLPEFGI